MRDLRARVAELERGVTARDRKIEALEADSRNLRELLEEARRAGKRQAAPFSKGQPKPGPKPPGRKAGKEHGPAAFRCRRRPTRCTTRPCRRSAPAACCGVGIEEERVAHQYQTEIPKVKPIVRRFDIHIGHYLCCGRRFLRNHKDQILTFLHRADLEATSWPADHAIRPAVLFRKVSGGHRSDAGARTHEILLSIYRTCWQRCADAIALTRKALCSSRQQVLGPPAAATAR